MINEEGIDIEELRNFEISFFHFYNNEIIGRSRIRKSNIKRDFSEFN